MNPLRAQETYISNYLQIKNKHSETTLKHQVTIKLLNDLPNNLKDIDKPNTMKKKIKKYLSKIMTFEPLCRLI